MKSEEIDALETIFGDMGKDELAAVADGLRDMYDQETAPKSFNSKSPLRRDSARQGFQRGLYLSLADQFLNIIY